MSISWNDRCGHICRACGGDGKLTFHRCGWDEPCSCGFYASVCEACNGTGSRKATECCETSERKNK